MTAAALLLSTFCLVFFLGLQSQLVNNGHHVGAFLNSVAIGTSNLVLFKLAPNASGWEIAAYLAGGPFGIVASMAFYRWLRRPKPDPTEIDPGRIMSEEESQRHIDRLSKSL